MTSKENSCSYHAARMGLFVVNLIVVICSVAMITIGSMALKMLTKYSKTDEMYLKRVFISVIVESCLLIIVGLNGFFSVAMESVRWLHLYAIMVILLCAGQIVCAVLGGIFRTKINKAISDSIFKYTQGYYNTPTYMTIMDSLQRTYHCCGAQGPWDYGNQSIPHTCYVSIYLNNDGCVGPFMDTFRQRTMIVLTLFCGSLGAQAVALSLVFCVTNDLRRRRLMRENRSTWG